MHVKSSNVFYLHYNFHTGEDILAQIFVIDY